MIEQIFRVLFNLHISRERYDDRFGDAFGFHFFDDFGTELREIHWWGNDRAAQDRRTVPGSSAPAFRGWQMHPLGDAVNLLTTAPGIP